MANLVIGAEHVTVSLSAVEKVEALHGDLTLPQSAVVSARAVPDGMAEVHGVRAPGMAFPGAIMVGTWRDTDGVTFAVCHGRRPAVVLDLVDQAYARVVITVDNPEAVVASLT